MFCFCFQSPSLKMHALEADLGPPSSPIDPQGQDYLPAQTQPLSTEEQSLVLTHKLLLPSPPGTPAQDREDSPQSGKSKAMKCRDTVVTMSFVLLKIISNHLMYPLLSCFHAKSIQGIFSSHCRESNPYPSQRKSHTLYTTYICT